jgi:hypothetical protein
LALAGAGFLFINTMRIIRYTLYFGGNALRSVELVNQLIGQFVVDDLESIGSPADEWDMISVHPPVAEVISEFDEPYPSEEELSRLHDYEHWFADFLETNAEALPACGVDEISILMEIFYVKGDQCNFEIFDRDILARLVPFKVALPISIYALGKKQMNDWSRKLRQAAE